MRIKPIKMFHKLKLCLHNTPPSDNGNSSSVASFRKMSPLRTATRRGLTSFSIELSVLLVISFHPESVSVPPRTVPRAAMVD